MSSADPVAAAFAGLQASHAAGRLAHAYLVIGSPRAEGLAFAKEVARLVLCEGLTPPCGGCQACRQVESREHVDMLWLEPEKRSRIIGVEPMRAAVRQLAEKSFKGGWKVAILLHADRMNLESANAFLKTLEEPPPRTLILLVSDSPQSMLATILSRCQRIQLAAGERPVRNKWTGGLLDLLAQPMGGGALERLVRARQMQDLLDAEREQIGKEVDKEMEEDSESEAAADAAAGADEEAVETAATREVRDARVENRVRQVRSDLLHTILLWQRDVLLLTVGGDEGQIHFQDRLPQLRESAKRTNRDSQVHAIRATEALIRRMERNVKPEIVSFEASFLTHANS